MEETDKAIDFLTEAANFFYSQRGYENIGRELFELLEKIDNIREELDE